MCMHFFSRAPCSRFTTANRSWYIGYMDTLTHSALRGPRQTASTVVSRLPAHPGPRRTTRAAPPPRNSRANDTTYTHVHSAQGAPPRIITAVLHPCGRPTKSYISRGSSCSCTIHIKCSRSPFARRMQSERGHAATLAAVASRVFGAHSLMLSGHGLNSTTCRGRARLPPRSAR